MLQVMQNRENPVEQNVMETLPEFTVDDLTKLPADKKNCVICLNDFEKGQKILIIPCTHFFHSDCIKSWFQSKNTCPICKYKIVAEDNLEQLL
jgi:hypothetical protein